MGWVYFIGDRQSAWIKIGYAKDVAARFDELQCATHEQLEVIAQVQSDPAGERDLHRALTGLRRREWFVKDSSVLLALELAVSGQSIECILHALNAHYAEQAAAAHETRAARLKRMTDDVSVPEEIREVYGRTLARVQAAAAAAAAIGGAA